MTSVLAPLYFCFFSTNVFLYYYKFINNLFVWSRLRGHFLLRDYLSCSFKGLSFILLGFSTHMRMPGIRMLECLLEVFYIKNQECWKGMVTKLRLVHHYTRNRLPGLHDYASYSRSIELLLR